jgi:hypothetical protein
LLTIIARNDSFQPGQIVRLAQEAEISFVALCGEKNRDSPVSDDIRGLVRRNASRR